MTRIDLEKSLCLLKKQIEIRTLTTNNVSLANGLHFFRLTSGRELMSFFYHPSITVVAQGELLLRCGGREILLPPGSAFLCGLRLPLELGVPPRTREHPNLAFGYELDLLELSKLSLRIPRVLGTTVQGFPAAMGAGEVDEELLDSIVRLVACLGTPEEEFLKPVLEREVHLRLLLGSLGSQIRSIFASDSVTGRIALAASRIADHYQEPLSVEALARECAMSPSSFHLHFKNVTGVSPLQYQKRLRLREARRLILEEGLPVGAAAAEVGYANASQFMREFKRLYGETPGQARGDFREKFTGRSGLPDADIEGDV